MSEKFDMNIYNNALNNGSYTPPKDATPQPPTIQYVGDSSPESNVIYMTEGFKLQHVEHKDFSEKADK